MDLHASRLLRLLPRVGDIARFSVPLADGTRLAPAAYRILHVIAPRGDAAGEVGVSLIDPSDEEAEGPVLRMTIAGAVAGLHRGPTPNDWEAAEQLYCEPSLRWSWTGDEVDEGGVIESDDATATH